MSNKYQELFLPPAEGESVDEGLRFEIRPRTVQTLLTNEQIEGRGLAIIDDQLEPVQFSSDVHEITRSKLFQRQWLVEAETPEAVRQDDVRLGWINAVEERIIELRQLADDEELPFSEVSANALVNFCGHPNPISQPSVFLLGNGNLRLLWLNDRQEQVGLQFRENLIQYVLFRARGETLVQTMGVDTADGALDTIRRLGLLGLMRA